MHYIENSLDILRSDVIEIKSSLFNIKDVKSNMKEIKDILMSLCKVIYLIQIYLICFHSHSNMDLLV